MGGLTSLKIRGMAEAMAQLSRKKITVGWIDPEAKHKDPVSGKQTISLGKIARVLSTGWEAGVGADGREYPRLPARDFFSVARKLYSKKLNVIVKKAMKTVAKQKQTADEACEMLAVYWEGKVQAAMRKSGEYEKLAESTIAARSNTHRTVPAENLETPLIDAGVLIASITHKVT
jgi:hypothetical protein